MKVYVVNLTHPHEFSVPVAAFADKEQAEAHAIKASKEGMYRSCDYDDFDVVELELKQ